MTMGLFLSQKGSQWSVAEQSSDITEFMFLSTRLNYREQTTTRAKGGSRVLLGANSKGSVTITGIHSSCFPNKRAVGNYLIFPRFPPIKE
jgi:hypothetical protein